MKATRNVLIILLAGVIGWFLGFLRLPYVEKNLSFLMGFIACVAVVLLLPALWFTWKKHADVLRLIGRDTVQQHSKSVTRTYAIIWILVAAFIVAGGLLSSFLIHRQSTFFKAQLQQQNTKIQEQSELIESVRKGNLIFLMSNILDNVEEELKNNSTLSDAVIARIAALSFSFKPYKYLEGDSLSAKEWSPERGQLLMALILMKMDSGSFSRIKQSTPFAGADLRGANLKNADLSGANLNAVNLKETDLSDADLSRAGLKDANLWAANLNNANLSGADLKRSDLRYAELNGADLTFTNMDGAQLSGAQLMKADAREASIQYANLDGALLNEANLRGVHLLGTAMSKVNLTSADLTSTDLRMINLNEGSLLGTKLNKASVDSNWMNKISEWRLDGVKEIQKNYSVVRDSMDQWKNPVYRLRKIEE